ncbi:MAG TPA: hypothetical protein VJV78_06300 [Polyangiales bacterium]|nr:hypothetical protein [Polyangiales bacterium]
MARAGQSVLWFAACVQLVSCALETDTNDVEVDAVESALRATESAGDPALSVEAENPRAAQRQSGGTGDTKSKSDLENDGYTCRALEGTTLTLCWKNGSPGYSCDPQGRCIQDARTAPDSPFGTLPDVAVQAELVSEKTPFCLPGEKRVCKLGPPPVCTCEPLTSPIVSASFEAR